MKTATVARMAMRYALISRSLRLSLLVIASHMPSSPPMRKNRAAIMTSATTRAAALVVRGSLISYLGSTNRKAASLGILNSPCLVDAAGLDAAEISECSGRWMVWTVWVVY